MQNQKSTAILMDLLSRTANVHTSIPYVKAEMPRIACQFDWSATVTDGTTVSIQPQGSLDGTSWRVIGSPATATASATVKGVIGEWVTAVPLMRFVVTTGVNTSTFSLMAVGGM
jgi:hypothetical protein